MRTLRGLGLILVVVVVAASQAEAKHRLIQEEPGRRISGSAETAGIPAERAFVARYPLEPAGSVTIDNTQGDIIVAAWDRAEAEVAVIKQALGLTADPDDVQIDVAADGRSLSLRTLYPKQSEEPVRVTYRLRVPRQVRLERLRTVVGSVRVRDTEGALDARTLNGNIEGLNLTGSVMARAINGSIAVSLRALPEGAPRVKMETVNGHLYLGLPAEANADLQLRTVAGRIEGNYAFKVSEAPGDASWRTTLGQGGTQIYLRTVRGNIQVVESEELL
jgi:hypothetical protein